MDFNFEDFIPVYPLQDDVNIQRIIGTKKEFLDVKGVYNEASPSLGNLYKHQEAFKRYMIQYDTMLNIHSMGTGKTCALVAVVEFMKNNPNFKKAYILEKGDTTKEEFKKQIATKCTKGVYTEENDDNKRGAITRAVKKVYNIMSYGDLAKEVKVSGDSPEEIEKNYSGCIFIVDEAHNLIENIQGKINKETGEEIDQEPDALQKEPKDIYKILWKLFHNVKRSKIILATATPMLNDVSEITKIMNLILPIDQQMPLDWDYDKITLQQLEPFFRGRVSYVRGLDSGVIEDYQGKAMNIEYQMEFADELQDEEIPFVAATKDLNGNEIFSPKPPLVKTSIKKYKSQNIIYPLIMSEFQSKAYINSIIDDEKNKNKNKGAFRRYEKDASCMVFPNGSYGGDFTSEKKLLKKAGLYIEKVGKNDFKTTNEFKRSFRNPNTLRDCSVKYDFIIKNELEVAKRREKGEIVGNAFCYSELKSGSGIIVLSKLLEEIGGFEKFNESSSVFTKDKFGNRVIRKDFDKKLRYGIIISGIESGELESLLELVNSPENYNGDYCQIVLGSLTSRDGINIYNALRGYLVVAGWHPSGTLQALARINRATSHDVILDKIKNKMLKDGKDTTNVKADIKIYKLASFTNFEDFNVLRKIKVSDKSEKTNSVDLDLYTLSDKKDISIRRMMRFLKQCAVDCSINYSRNIRPDDVDGSLKCDYGKCDYVCYTSHLKDTIPEKDVDYSTYDILYTDEIVKQCQCEIRNIISKKSSITINELYKYKDLALYKPRYINMAIDYIIKEKIKIKNRFGFPAFINTDGNVIFTQIELPTYTMLKSSNNISSINIYKDMLFTYNKSTYNNILSFVSNNDDDETLKIIMNMNIEENYEEFSTLFDKLSDDIKYNLLEDSIIKRANISNIKMDDELAFAILKKYESYIFVVNEPLTDIQNIKNYLETSDDRRGRNSKYKSCPSVNIPMIGPQENTEVIYIHILRGIKIDITSFRVNTQYLNPSEDIRILKPSEKEGWRNVYNYECQAYKNIILSENQKSFEQFTKFNYFGTIAQDKKFRIIETKDFNFNTEDLRSSSKGTVCSSYKQKFDLISILRESDYMPDMIRDIDLPYENRDEIEDYLLNVEKINKTSKDLEIYDYDDLIFFGKWFYAKKIASKNDICMYIQELFEKEGRIKYV